MTWYPLQAALKMSTIPGAIRATLDVLLDHINQAPGDPSRPDTLTVWESREDLAAETGFSEVTIRDHLKRLRGEADLRKGQRVTVLKCTAAAQSHRAARYELVPAALDALVDPARLEAFEAHPFRAGHAYHGWRRWRASQIVLPSVGESALPQTEVVGVSSLPQLGKASFPELPIVDPEREELTLFSPDAPDPEPIPEKKRTTGVSTHNTKSKTKTPPPQVGEARRQFIKDLTAWAQEGASGVDAARVLDLWLFRCEGKGHEFHNWVSEGKAQLREAYYALQDQVARQVWQTPALAEPLAPRCDYPTGCAQEPCPHGTRCASHAGCEICLAAAD